MTGYLRIAIDPRYRKDILIWASLRQIELDFTGPWLTQTEVIRFVTRYGILPASRRPIFHLHYGIEFRSPRDELRYSGELAEMINDWGISHRMIFQDNDVPEELREEYQRLLQEALSQSKNSSETC